jgi:hypothetical protein
MRIHTTLLIASCLTVAVYALPGCDEGGSKTAGPRPETTNTPSANNAGKTNAGANDAANTAPAPNPNGGGAGSTDESHGTIRPGSTPQHPNVVTSH